MSVLESVGSPVGLANKVNELSGSIMSTSLFRSPVVNVTLFEGLKKYSPVLEWTGVWELSLEGFSGLSGDDLGELLLSANKLVKAKEAAENPNPYVLWMKIEGENVEVAQTEPSDPTGWKKLVEEVKLGK